MTAPKLFSDWLYVAAVPAEIAPAMSVRDSSGLQLAQSDGGDGQTHSKEKQALGQP